MHPSLVRPVGAGPASSAPRSGLRALARSVVRLPALALLGLVRGYQLLLSPFFGGRCRFEPSCSRYAVACLENHGALRGGLLSIVRLCKCHPFHPGGFDPPPAPRERLPT
jgi:putative membrane protein insertion efficiency factor